MINSVCNWDCPSSNDGGVLEVMLIRIVSQYSVRVNNCGDLVIDMVSNISLFFSIVGQVVEYF